MLTRYCIMALSIAMAAITVCAEDPVPPVQPVKVQQPATQPAVTNAPAATNIISLIDETYRDPFWPADYVPKKAVLPQTIIDSTPSDGSAKPQKPKVKWPNLKVRSINKTKDGTFIAFIDGVGIAETGNIIKIKKEGYQFSWKVEGIEKTGIKLNPLDVRIAP